MANAETWNVTQASRGGRGAQRRAKVVKAEEPYCGLCGRLIDPTLSHPDPYSFTVDHVIPVAAGGTNDRWNLQAAHRVCNLRKQDNTGDGGGSATSVDWGV